MAAFTGAGMICGGLDIGGTKIEARLFDRALNGLDSRRLPTPQSDADGFFAAIGELAGWMRGLTGSDLPIGIAMSGLVDPATGIAHTANLPISGQNMAERLTAAMGRPLPVMNDSMALAFSEANGGAAEGSDSAVGLILGTGLAAGYCVGGAPVARFGGMAVELGHSGMPARALLRHGIGMWRCGCGREGCIEAYVAGPGLARLADHRGLGPLPAPEIAARAAAGDAAAGAVLDVWTDLAVAALEVLQVTLDPRVVVLGGGLSRMPGIVERLSAALPPQLMEGVPVPAIRLARFGDASGVRGAALLAQKIRLGELPWTP